MLALLFFLLMSPSPAATPAQSTPITAASGVTVLADLRAEYLSGFPLLVELAIQNPTPSVLNFPDLSARPFLVHFLMSTKGNRQDRFNTPPEKDPGTTWSIPSKSERRVLLEVPNSSGLDAGAWTLGVEIRDPAGTIIIPSRSIQLAEARPVTGYLAAEPLSAAAGSALTWLHQATSGFDLYLMSFQPRAPGKLSSQSYLLHTDARIEPNQSRTRAEDINARYIYWMAGPQSLMYLRLDGIFARTKPKAVSLPYPVFELAGQGVTDGAGGLMVPIWIPTPSGVGGSLKLLCLDAKGSLLVRKVADFQTRPAMLASSLDAAGNLLLAIGHSAGVDLYRADPTWASELPAKGIRVWKAEAGLTAAALSWDVLPNGLALQVLLLGPAGENRSYRRLHTSLTGTVLLDTGLKPWLLPSDPLSFYSDNAAAFYAIGKDTAGALYYLAQGSSAVKLSTQTPGMLFLDGETVKMRSLGGRGVVIDTVLGPKQ
jgi:hypothetical protein